MKNETINIMMSVLLIIFLIFGVGYCSYVNIIKKEPTVTILKNQKFETCFIADETSIMFLQKDSSNAIRPVSWNYYNTSIRFIYTTDTSLINTYSIYEYGRAGSRNQSIDVFIKNIKDVEPGTKDNGKFGKKHYKKIN